MSKGLKEKQAQRLVYQTEKTKLDMQRVATYLTEEERFVFFDGSGFIRVPEQERLHQRIDVYPYLIP